VFFIVNHFYPVLTFVGKAKCSPIERSPQEIQFLNIVDEKREKEIIKREKNNKER
jgi:hypothetical protein